MSIVVSYDYRVVVNVICDSTDYIELTIVVLDKKVQNKFFKKGLKKIHFVFRAHVVKLIFAYFCKTTHAYTYFYK